MCFWLSIVEFIVNSIEQRETRLFVDNQLCSFVVTYVDDQYDVNVIAGIMAWASQCHYWCSGINKSTSIYTLYTYQHIKMHATLA